MLATNVLVSNRFSIRIALLVIGVLLASCSTVREPPVLGGWGNGYGNGGSPRPDPGGEFKVTDQMVELLEGSAAVILIDERGNLRFVDRDGEGFELCTREPGSRQCKAFTTNARAKDISAIPILLFEGSQGVISMCTDGQLCQKCWDEEENKPVRCSRR